MTKVFTIASGKGGTGKTMTTANLGTALALLGKRTIILDADIGMANLGLVLGLEKSKITLHEVLAGKADISQAIYEMPTGLRVVPSGISLQGFQNADPDRLQFVMSKLVTGAEYVIIDAPAGISKDGVIPLAIADEVLLVVNPELSSLADSVKIKVLTEMVGGAVGGVILNRASTEKTMLTSQKIGQIMGAEVLEVIPEDASVRRAAAFKTPVVVMYPDSPSAKAYKRLAAKIAGSKAAVESIDSKKESFIDRLARSVFGGV
jgi:septum site-determining protein MinD